MSLGIFSILLLVIFTAELAVMEMLEPLFSHLSVLEAAFLDAGILVLLFALPLWFLFSQLLKSNIYDSNQRSVRSKRYVLFGRLLSIVFVVELFVMLFLPTFFPHITDHDLSILDASLTTILVLPVLWRMLSRIEQNWQKVPLADFLNSPIVLYTLLLYMVFLADLLQEVVLPYQSGEYSKLLDSIVTTMFIAPFVWLLVGRPLAKALQLERMQAKSVRDQVVDAVITLDADGRIDSMNPAAQTIFGFLPHELAGQSAEMLFSNDHLNIENLITIYSENSAESQEMIFREVVCRCRNNATLTMDISISNILNKGRRQWLLILHDISDRKEAERALRESDARLRQVFEQSDDAIVFFKPDSCDIIDTNDTFARLFGYTKLQLRSQGVGTLFNAVDLTRISNTIREIGRGRSVKIDKLIGVHHNGTKLNLSVRGKLMTLNDIDVVFCSFRDITNRIRLEKEAKDIQARLIQTNKMTSLGLLVSGVAHEINNPNNYIMANSRLLANTWEDNRKILQQYQREHGDFCLGGIPFSELDEHAPQLYAGIMDGAHRINDIVDNLKKFYRNKQTTESLSVDLNRVVKASISLLQHELVRFTENFSLNMAEDIPTIKGNSQQIGQVLINLVMNACQSLPSKKHAICVTTSYDPDLSEVQLIVSDEGGGMTEEDSRKIMEPFFTTKLDTGGTGLGLSISRSIIKEHNGRLEFISELGKGSTFTVKLPAFTTTTKD